MVLESEKKMKDWEAVLEKFIEKWKSLDYVEGALVTGSQVVGNATPNSDVDVHIILSEDIDWRERGNEMVDGVLIEYFANPTFFFKQYFDEDYANNGKQNARMFTIGKILFDKNGEVGKLVEQAQSYMNQAFTKPDDIWREVAKYGIWDELDGLEDVYKAKQPNFNHCYQIFLHNLLAKYTKFLGAEMPNTTKLHKYLSSADFRAKYHIDEYTDGEFATQLQKALEAEGDDEKYGLAKSLGDYTLEKMGGFNIDGWKLRTSATGDSRRTRGMNK